MIPANCRVNYGIYPLLKQNRYKYLTFKGCVFNVSQRNLIHIIIIMTIIIEHSLDSVQKIAMLGTSHTIRKVLQCET
jgi:hypothetical protein